jgi:isoamylase
LGSPYPQGSTVTEEGTNFAIYSENAERIFLELYKSPGDASPAETYELTERDGYVWHIFLPGVGAGQLYGYRVDGPYAPEKGVRFNRNKLLIDPYTKALTGPINWSDDIFAYVIGDEKQDLSFNANDDAGNMPKSVVWDDNFDWKGDRHPRLPWSRTVIYETHVKGLTMKHPEIEEGIRGTYSALASDTMIRHFKELGISAVELMPVHHKVDNKDLVDKGLRNYWGYNTIGYFAPEIRYSSGREAGKQIIEFKEMVRRLHENGIEVILDVVYNHTAEGNHLGPTLSFRGIDNLIYYRLDEKNPRYYVDFTGTGNSLNARHPQVLQLIMDSLRYWIQEMHVDGFRFDLAATLAREFYEVDRLSSFFDVIHQDPVVSRVKLIAEPWDVGPGGYQIGRFPILWAEWNGKYRDAVRQYWNSSTLNTGEFATRISGSPDLYGNGRRPRASINYVTCHDGFTLYDLVSYSRKHNEANLEDNKDGMDQNWSDNMGVEGETDNEEIMHRRERRMRCLLITLLTSQGVPMLLGGDEIMRTQRGNNNAYCQDNDISWYSWALDERKRRMLEFTKHLIHIRTKYHVLRRRNFFRGVPPREGLPKDVTWLRPDGKEMSPDDWRSIKAIAVLLSGLGIEAEEEELMEDDVLLLFNPTPSDVEFTVPSYWHSLEILADAEPEHQSSYPIRLNGDRVTVKAGGAAVIRGVRRS